MSRDLGDLHTCGPIRTQHKTLRLRLVGSRVWRIVGGRSSIVLIVVWYTADRRCGHIVVGIIWLIPMTTVGLGWTLDGVEDRSSCSREYPAEMTIVLGPPKWSS